MPSWVRAGLAVNGVRADMAGGGKGVRADMAVNGVHAGMADGGNEVRADMAGGGNGVRADMAVNGVRGGCSGKIQLRPFSCLFCLLSSCTWAHNIFLCLWLISGGGGGAAGLGGEDADYVKK